METIDAIALLVTFTRGTVEFMNGDPENVSDLVKACDVAERFISNNIDGEQDDTHS